MQNINYTIFLDNRVKIKIEKFNFNLLYSLIDFLHLYNKWSSVFVIGYPSHYVSFQVSVLVGNDRVAFQLGVYFCVMVTVVSDELFPNNAGVNLYADEIFLFLNNSRYITLCLSIQENFIKWIKRNTIEILSTFSIYVCYFWVIISYI